MIGMIGKDSQGEKLIQNLVDNGVKADNVIKSDELTGRAIITVDRKGDNNIIVIPGSNFKITKEHIQAKQDVIASSDVVILQNEIPSETVEFSLLKAKELGKITIFNPAPARKLSGEVFKNTDYLILNETEMEEIFEIKFNDEEYTEKISIKKKEYGIKNIILTLGDKGSILFSKDNNIKKYEEYGYDKLPVCISKTQKSLSDNPKLLGRPTGFEITINEIRLSAGAGFLVAMAGEIIDMPGLPKKPSAELIDIDENGVITGLF